MLITVLTAVLLAGVPLIEAVKSSDTAAVRALLQKKADVNATEPDGTTALLWASYKDDVEIADLLIRAGANVNAANDLGATPLWTAGQNGSAAMVRRLLQAGANPNAALLSGESTLMVASRSGNADIVEQLLAKGANVNARAARGQTALMWAVAQKHAPVVKALLAHGADVNARSEVWSMMMAVPPHGVPEYNKEIPHGGETAFMFAARAGDLSSATLLLAAGANVNDADAWGVSALVLAAHSGYRELAEYLLENGADPNAAGRRLFRAAYRHRPARREDGGRAPRARRGRECATRNVDPHAALVEGLELRARTGRCDTVLAGRPFRAARPDAPPGETRRRSIVRAPCRLHRGRSRH